MHSFFITPDGNAMQYNTQIKHNKNTKSSALSGDFVLLPPELPSFDEPGLSSDGGPSLFVVQTFGTLFPQLSAP